MDRLVIKISELYPAGSNQSYPVSVYCEETGGVDWKMAPVHTGTIAASLLVDGTGWDADRLIDCFLNTNGQSHLIDDGGSYLGNLLDQSGAGRFIKDKHEASFPDDDTTHFRLILDIEPPDVRRLPWELLRWGSNRCFIDSRNPAFRSTLGDMDKSSDGIVPPIRVLIAIGAAANDEQIKAENEVLVIRRALMPLGRLVDVDVLQQPTKGELENAIRTDRPHIFHFCGHGGEYDKNPSLFLYDADDDEKKPWTTQAISLTLNDWAPRIVFLNACKSASADVQRNISSVAAEFVRAGCAAVIGTNSDINDSTAAQFAGAVYTAIAKGNYIDEAVAAARFEVQSKIGYDNREWATPALHVGVAPDSVLKLAIKPDPNLIGCTEFDSINYLVDRHTPRRQLWRGIDPAFETGVFGDSDARPLTVIKGPDTVGKSATLLWGLSVCMLRGYQVIYIELDDGKGKNFIDVLRLIRDGNLDSPSPLREPLPESDFAEFNWCLIHSGKGEKTPALPEGSTTVKDIFKEPYQGGEDSFTQLFDTYRKALEAVAVHRPLIIALDQMKVLDPHDFTKTLWPYLFHWVAAGRLKNVRMVLVTSMGEYDNFDLAANEPSFTKIEVGGFPASAYRELVLEYLIYRDTDLDEARDLSEILGAMRTAKGHDWLPEQLEFAYRVLN